MASDQPQTLLAQIFILLSVYSHLQALLLRQKSALDACPVSDRGELFLPQHNVSVRVSQKPLKRFRPTDPFSVFRRPWLNTCPHCMAVMEVAGTTLEVAHDQAKFICAYRRKYFQRCSRYLSTTQPIFYVTASIQYPTMSPVPALITFFNVYQYH